MEPLLLGQNPRILIVLLGSLGDVARGLAIVDAIKQARPAAHIAWLVEPKCEALVRLHRRIDQIIVFERAGGWSSMFSLKRELKKSSWDVCLDLQRHFKSGLFSRWSSAPVRVGFHRKDCKEGNWIFNTHYLPALGEDGPKLLHYLYFVERLGLADANKLYAGEICFGYDDHPSNELLAPDLQRELAACKKPLLGIGLGSTWESKDWPIMGYRELISTARPTFDCVLLGDQSQLQKVNALELGNTSGVHNLVGKLTLAELIGVLKLLRVYVGPDSGPVHMASACSIPCVSMFGPTSPQRVAPYRNEAGVMQAELGCIACYRKRCPGLGTLCMRLLDPQKVYQQIQQAASA